MVVLFKWGAFCKYKCVLLITVADFQWLYWVEDIHMYFHSILLVYSAVQKILNLKENCFTFEVKNRKSADYSWLFHSIRHYICLSDLFYFILSVIPKHVGTQEKCKVLRSWAIKWIYQNCTEVNLLIVIFLCLNFFTSLCWKNFQWHIMTQHYISLHNYTWFNTIIRIE